MPGPSCTYLECNEPPVVKVSGGVPAREVTVGPLGSLFHAGWMGLYCRKHALSCVDNQLFQAETGLPIVIEQVPQ